MAATAALLIALAGCQHNPPSPEADIAAGMAKLARTPGYVTVEDIETILRLRQLGMEMKSRNVVYTQHGRDWVQSDSLVSFDAVRLDAKIKYAVIDNVAHGGDSEQEVRLDLSGALCVTADIMRRASGVTPQPYKDTWVPPPHYPSHYYRPPVYDLEFVIRDRFPEDQRKIFLGGKAPCFNVVVVMKHFGGK